MNRKEIINYVKNNKCVRIAELQKTYEIAYGDAKSVIDELLNRGDLVYAGGVTYNYIGKSDAKLSELERKRAEALKKLRGEDGAGRARHKRFSDYLRLSSLRDDDDEDDDDDDDEDDETDEDEEELRRKALEFCIEEGQASVSLLQRTFPIGYIKACKIIDWMEKEGYITPQNGPWARKILITEEEFNNKFRPYGNLFDDEDDDEEDDDDEEEEGENSERAIKSLEEYMKLHPDLFRIDAPPLKEEKDEEFKAQAQRLATVVKRISDKKSAPVSEYIVPPHPLWADDEELEKEVYCRMRQLVKSDKRLGRKGAIKKAETYLESVRDTHDAKMIQVYERLVYELKNMSDDAYAFLKSQLFD